MAGVYSDPKHRFVNPYNFIPLAKECNRTQPGEDEKLLTGYIDCELKTLTPTIISDIAAGKEDEKVNGHMIYGKTVFLNGRPAIPASEVRGMIRSKFEVLTASCMSSAEPELEFFSRYKGKNMNKPAILDLKTGKMYECDARLFAKKCRNRFEGPDGNNSEGRYVTGDIVHFYEAYTEEYNVRKQRDETVYRAFPDAKKSSLKGYVRVGGKFAKEMPVHVFVLKEKEIHADNEADFLKLYKEIKEKCREGNNNERHVAESKNNMQPVWYEKIRYTRPDGSTGYYVYFSLTQNGQTKYRRKFKDLIPEDFLPCDKKGNLCEACRLFGTVNDKKNLAAHGKLRFEDAMLDNSCIRQNPDEYYAQKNLLLLEELATPRYENAGFYMAIKDDSGKSVVRDESPYSYSVDTKSDFRTYEIQDGDIEIRGRKEYWRFKPALKDANEKTQRNVSVRPLKEGLKYNFRVYFEGISRAELEHLRMTLSLGNKSDYAHKIGGGKPLGFGSVKIKTKEVRLRRVSFADGKLAYSLEKYAEPEYKDLFDAFDAENLEESMKAIKHMYDVNFLQDHIDKKEFIVDYPRERADGKIFEWFAKNEKQNGFKKVLPFADGEYDELVQRPSVKTGKGNKNNDNRNGNRKHNSGGNNNYKNGKSNYSDGKGRR